VDFHFINGIKIYVPNDRSQLIDKAVIEKKFLIAINAEKIMNLSQPEKKIINLNIAYADGAGTVMALNKKGVNKAEKIPGCELWLDVISRYYDSKSFYIVGSKQVVLDQAIYKLKQNFPGINIINYRNGYFNNESEYELLYQEIKNKMPDIIFVAMGSPAQEKLIVKLNSIHNATYMGLGGSLDVYTGFAKRAPSWWISSNLEWAYRLFSSPKRILRQYVFLKFLVYMYLNKF
jgi:UDP-N-acetyl-D-mannosaminouronate:lipid I N-acetyl-D-mannosaminouronosyltransferase